MVLRHMRFVGWASPTENPVLKIEEQFVVTLHGLVKVKRQISKPGALCFRIREI